VQRNKRRDIGVWLPLCLAYEFNDHDNDILSIASSYRDLEIYIP